MENIVEQMKALRNRIEELSLGQQTSGIRYEDFLKHLNRNPTKAKEFWSWFRGSQVVDPNGRPLVVYHGGGQYRESLFPYSHFGNLKASKDATPTDGRVGAYFLDIRNPLKINDIGNHMLAGYLRELNRLKIVDQHDLMAILGRSIDISGKDVPRSPQDLDAYAKAVIKTKDRDNPLLNDPNGEIAAWISEIEQRYAMDTSMSGSEYHQLESMTPTLDQKGIDGFRYVNKYEGSGRSISWIPLRSEQIAPVGRFISL